MGGHHKKNLRKEKAKVQLKGAKLAKGTNVTKAEFKVSYQSVSYGILFKIRLQIFPGPEDHPKDPAERHGYRKKAQCQGVYY